MLLKMLPIIKRKEYKYYCIYNYLNPFISATMSGVSGNIGAAASYNNMGHFTLYGPNVKQFSTSMLSLGKSMVGNPWKKEMGAKQLKAVTSNIIKKKEDVPKELQKYVI